MTKKLCGCNDPMRDEKGVFPTHPAKSYKQQIAEKDARIAELEAQLLESEKLSREAWGKAFRSKERVAELESIVDNLPRTVDGVVASDGDIAWFVDAFDTPRAAMLNMNAWGISLKDCYSTREAAQSAIDAREGKG